MQCILSEFLTNKFKYYLHSEACRPINKSITIVGQNILKIQLILNIITNVYKALG